MDIFTTDRFVLPLPPEHRFPMSKYRLLREAVEVEAGQVVRAAGSPLSFLDPPSATDDQLRLAHTADYVERATQGLLDAKEVRRMGFPWSAELIERSRRSVGATIAGARSALRDGAAANLAGGTHHAFAHRGEGFCVFNDAAVASRLLIAEGTIERAIIIDLDVHQGNGTASILEDDPAAFTLSLHGANNFPFHKEQSDLDVAFPDRTGDDEYLGGLDEALARVGDWVTSASASAGPTLAIYLAGADAFEGDRLGRLSLTKEGLAERDRKVYAFCREFDLPVVVAMAGGYAPTVEDTVEIHRSSVMKAAGLTR